MLRFHDAGPDIRVAFDNDSARIRVQINAVASQTWLMPIWYEVAAIGNSSEWRESPYASKITDEILQELIDWFWVDAECPPGA